MIEVAHDPVHHRFVAVVEGREAHLSYQPAGAGVLDYESTFVPEQLRDRGIASTIVREALDYARQGHYRVIPSCWFVRGFVERHPEYQDLIAGSGN